MNIENNKVSVCIIAKNEEQSIGQVLERLQPEYYNELLLIDGNSTDRTREIAKAFGAKVYIDPGGGKGIGVREAIKKASGDILVFIDADGSHDPADIPKLVKPIRENEADFVIGSRMLGGSDESHGDLDKFLRGTGSNIITLGINYRFKQRLTDSQNGFRAVKASCARQLNLKEKISTIEQEMLIKILRKGFRVLEAPTHEYKRLYGQSVIKLRKVLWRYFYSWLKYLIMD